MRCIDVRGLKDIGHTADGPWRLGDDRLLRASSFWGPFDTPQKAQALFDTYRAAHLATAVTPDALELVQVVAHGERSYGVVVEYVRGLGLDAHVAFGSYLPDEAAGEIGALQRQLNQACMPVGIDWKDRFLTWSRALAPYLTRQLGTMLAMLVEAVPADDALVHGDLHMGNVVVKGGRPAPIDMELAGFGFPVFDLAISRSRMYYSAPRQAQARGFDLGPQGECLDTCWRAWLRGYLGDADEGQLERLDRRLAVLAEVENCGFEYRIAEVSADNLSDWQRERVARAAMILADLLPQVDCQDSSLYC